MPSGPFRAQAPCPRQSRGTGGQARLAARGRVLSKGGRGGWRAVWYLAAWGRCGQIWKSRAQGSPGGGEDGALNQAATPLLTMSDLWLTSGWALGTCPRACAVQGGRGPKGALKGRMGPTAGGGWSHSHKTSRPRPAIPHSLPGRTLLGKTNTKWPGPCQAFLEEARGRGSGQTAADPEVTGEAKAGPGPWELEQGPHPGS